MINSNKLINEFFGKFNVSSKERSKVASTIREVLKTVKGKHPKSGMGMGSDFLHKKLKEPKKPDLVPKMVKPY